MSEAFDAYVLEERGPAVLRQLSERDLPDAEVTVDVSHSSLAPTVERKRAWHRIGADLPQATLDAITSVHGFGELPDLAGQILAGQVRGRVVPLVGAAWAKYLMLTGEIIDARRAAAIGLVLEIEEPDDLLARCTDLARRLARMPRAAVILNKASIDSMLEAAGRGAGRSIGRLHDVLTRSMTHEAAAPDGRKFEEILEKEGMRPFKAARDTQYGAPWLRPLRPLRPFPPSGRSDDRGDDRKDDRTER